MTGRAAPLFLEIIAEIDPSQRRTEIGLPESVVGIHNIYRFPSHFYDMRVTVYFRTSIYFLAFLVIRLLEHIQTYGTTQVLLGTQLECIIPLEIQIVLATPLVVFVLLVLESLCKMQVDDKYLPDIPKRETDNSINWVVISILPDCRKCASTIYPSHVKNDILYNRTGDTRPQPTPSKSYLLTKRHDENLGMSNPARRIPEEPDTHPTPVEPMTCSYGTKHGERTCGCGCPRFASLRNFLLYVRPNLLLPPHHQAMFSGMPHHESVYGYYDELVEEEKQSYQEAKTTIATAHQIQDELKELRQETALLMYRCQCITARTPKLVPPRAVPSTTLPKRKRKSSSSATPVLHRKPSSAMLQMITNTNLLKELTRKKRKV
ncbi:uncharacterized protein EV420DRAFT_1487849 [Desarmillaria tabescens]|uniref:Uncharacterized protein n=1 Tax=Armillaria tabescens TaxID=1929756 RepID=A0AA39MJK4_ARMTA|nr:uncharacterized protein EV420DRAFT_1487849 [Desarmillaria tabescens]KAK0435800.1 hypothetical protein EV420DRAFT_1487849 [Desarmillaria tabescens]